MLFKVDPQLLLKINQQILPKIISPTLLKIDPELLLKIGFQTFSKIWPHLLVKIDPQMVLKRWSTNGTHQVIHKRYSKSDQETLLKIDPQLLLKINPQIIIRKLPKGNQKNNQKRYSKGNL